MTTSSADKKYLRSLGHPLKPVVTVAGNGLTESVVTEINRALNDHELIISNISYRVSTDVSAVFCWATYSYG